MLGTSFANKTRRRKEAKHLFMTLNEKEQQIRRLILNYLQKNPKAEDTIEGIAGWWLEFEQIEVSVDEVQDALGSLLEEGAIRMRKTTDGNIFYKTSNE